MKVNRRLLIESIIVSILIILLGLGWNISQGYFLTKNYVPDIIDNYKSSDYLQHKVSFGILYKGNWISMIVGIGAFLFLIITYYGIRTWLNHMKYKFKVKKGFE